MSQPYAFAAEVEGPPPLKFYVYQTKQGADGKTWWMFTVDEYDSMGRSSPLVERLGETLSEVAAYVGDYTSEPVEWGWMAGGEAADLDAIIADLEG